MSSKTEFVEAMRKMVGYLDTDDLYINNPNADSLFVLKKDGSICLKTGDNVGMLMDPSGKIFFNADEIQFGSEKVMIKNAELGDNVEFSRNISKTFNELATGTFGAAKDLSWGSKDLFKRVKNAIKAGLK